MVCFAITKKLFEDVWPNVTGCLQFPIGMNVARLYCHGMKFLHKSLPSLDCGWQFLGIPYFYSAGIVLNGYELPDLQRVMNDGCGPDALLEKAKGRAIGRMAGVTSLMARDPSTPAGSDRSRPAVTADTGSCSASRRRWAAYRVSRARPLRRPG